MKAAFPELFQSGRIGTMSVPNRIVMPPMGTNLADPQGFVTDRIREYYQARARGGAGLVIVEVTGIDLAQGRAIPCQLGIDDDKLLPGLASLAQAIKKPGARAAVQIHHAGRLAWRHAEPVGPSAIRVPPSMRIPRELTRGEIEGLVEKFARGARRAQEAGFDGVEVHGAHQYLISQFLSPATNKRQDEYGRDLRGRARFFLEIIRACRRETGGKFPIWCRISAHEFGLDGGITLEEALPVAKWAQEAGADSISVSCYGVGSYGAVNMPHIPGAIAYLAEAVKGVVQVPVMAVGRLGPAPGARLLREGKADFVAIGRALLVDPDWARKVRRGQVEDIRPCIGCLECLTITTSDQSIHCTPNPFLGREREGAIRKVTRPRQVMVVGGGPGGMEAARVAALRGHQVTLYEKGPELGGQLLVADKPPQKNHIHALKSYLARQVQEVGVSVVLGKEVTPQEVAAIKPDALILATGCTPFLPQLPGLEKRPVVTAVEVLAGRAPVGERVVVMGAERVGCETADFLASQGKKVTLTRRGTRLATRLNPLANRELRDRLLAGGVQVLTGVQYLEVTQEGLVVLDREGQRQVIPCDTIVSAVGARPNDGLFQALRGWYEVYPVGDVLGPKGIWEALAEGWRAGLAV